MTGVLLGLSAGLAPGPLLTLVITETLQQDIKAGIKVAVAPLITDLPIIIVSLFVLTKFANSDVALGVVSIAGALFVAHIAYETFVHKSVAVNLDDTKSQSLINGILANALSPHPYLFWITVGAPIMTKAMKTSGLTVAVFLLGFYFFLIGSKVSLALVVGKSKGALTGGIYLYIMRFLGLALAVLASILLIDGLKFLDFI